MSYQSRPTPAPQTVYCDSSFLLDIFIAGSPSRLAGTSAPKQARAKAAREFFVWGKQQGIRFQTSVLALEEIAQALVLSPVNAAARAQQSRTWKDLRTGNPALFATKLQDGRRMLASFQAFLSTLQLVLVLFGRTSAHDENQSSRRIARYARTLLASFELDAMDAYHIAVARFCNISWTATSDSDWAAIPTITAVGAV